MKHLENNYNNTLETSMITDLFSKIINFIVICLEAKLSVNYFNANNNTSGFIKWRTQWNTRNQEMVIFT